MSWFAVQTRSNFEARVHASFAREGIPDLYPFYRQTRSWSDREKVIERPIFPGYLFVDLESGSRGQVFGASGVLRILASPIPQSEIELVERLISCPDALESAVPDLYRPQQGDTVRIGYGPMIGLEGRVTRVKGKLRVWVSIPSMMCGVPVQVDAQSLRRVRI